MFRGILPFILAILGLLIIVLAGEMILFQWQISKIAVSDSLSTYNVDFPPVWGTPLGVPLDDSTYVFRRIQVWRGMGERCLNFNFVVKRSPNDKALEQFSLNINKYVTWLLVWALIEIVLSAIYIWFFIIWDEHRSFSEAATLIFVVAIVSCFAIAVLRQAIPIFNPGSFIPVDGCYGTITLNARLSKIHYEVPFTFLAGILAELGALGMMVNKLKKL